jgi:hypothetical protein
MPSPSGYDGLKDLEAICLAYNHQLNFESNEYIKLNRK